MMGNRYRRVYGATHDTVHIRDDNLNRRIRDDVQELNILNETTETLYDFIKKQGYELIRIEEDYDVKWRITTPEEIKGYSGEADIKTYDEYLESIKR